MASPFVSSSDCQEGKRLYQEHIRCEVSMDPRLTDRGSGDGRLVLDTSQSGFLCSGSDCDRRSGSDGDEGWNFAAIPMLFLTASLLKDAGEEALASSNWQSRAPLSYYGNQPSRRSRRAE